MYTKMYTLTVCFIWLSNSLWADLSTTMVPSPQMSYDDQVRSVKEHMKQLRVESVTIESLEKEGCCKTLKRNAFLAIRPEALGTIIFCHGYTSSKHESFFFKSFFPHFNAMAFDFRAHGDMTDGQVSTIGVDEVYDIKGAVEFIKSHPETKDKPIIGFGFSMGAVALLKAQARWPELFDVIILDSPFDSSDICIKRNLDAKMSITLFGKSLKLPGSGLIVKSMYNERLMPFVKYIFKVVTGFNPNQIQTKYMRVAPIETVHMIKIPCFFVTCEKDNKVSIESVRNLYEHCGSEYKRMWITPGIKHCASFLSNSEQYWYRLNKFLKKVFEGDMKVKEKIIDDRVSMSAL